MAADAIKREDIKTKEQANKRTSEKNVFRQKLKSKMDEYCTFVFDSALKFPREEIYVTVAQWKRSSLSIILNYIEGYARIKPLVQLNFFGIAYGSYKEAKYLTYFSKNRGYLAEADYQKGMEILEEIGAMLWTEIGNIRKNLKN